MGLDCHFKTAKDPKNVENFEIFSLSLFFFSLFLFLLSDLILSLFFSPSGQYGTLLLQWYPGC